MDFTPLILEYFELLDFSFDIFPNIIPENQHYVEPPNGFKKLEIDSFLFRNLSSYIVITWSIIFLYIFIIKHL